MYIIFYESFFCLFAPHYVEQYDWDGLFTEAIRNDAAVPFSTRLFNTRQVSREDIYTEKLIYWAIKFTHLPFYWIISGGLNKNSYMSFPFSYMLAITYYYETIPANCFIFTNEGECFFMCSPNLGFPL